MVYRVNYKIYGADRIRGIDVIAKSKYEAYDKATYEMIPALEGEMAYSTWVSSVTYQNGNYREFNTHEGNPY